MDISLEKMIATQLVPHSLLFVGDHLREEAQRFAQKLILSSKKHTQEIQNSKNYPDIHHYHVEGKTGMHAISALRELAEQVALSPFEGKWKIFIIHDAERMLPTSANALLKTFEEPTAGSVILLLSPHPERILPTILSRCQVLYFPRVEKPTVTALQNQLLDLLGDSSFTDKLEVLCVGLEKERKEWEKKMWATLPDELTPLQKGAYGKEIEGASAMRYQEKTLSLLQTVILWHRDRALLEIEGGERFLHFPTRIAEIKKTPLLFIEHVEELVMQSRLALERSVKLSICLQVLFTQLFQYSHKMR